MEIPPSVGVPPEVVCKVGETVLLSCDVVDANPSDVDYRWYLGNGEIFSFATIYLSNITRDLHGDQFCTANNTYHDGTYGTGSNVTFLDVQYAPVVKNSKSVTKEKDTVVLICHVDSNPYPSEFQWLKEAVLLSSESTYTIDDVTRDDAGNYTCAVTAVFYDETNASDEGIVYLEVQYAARLIPSDDREFKAEIGEVVDINCTSHGMPMPSIKWFDGSETEINNHYTANSSGLKFQNIV
ncbi:cell adhesion molecule CEACAM1-like [Ptychodera flava]|uniref:cell adhesion molecule CEACAM1-like n=1 Tax=Ptychodera flava TaxID=63121 RepID=UPI00396A3AF8